MQEYCHRCGGELPASDGVSPFCPHCGAPQIYLQDYEQQSGAPEVDTTGAVPPPRPQQVEWKTAIRCAVLVAGIAAVLGLVASLVQVISPLSWLWTISGSIITLALYQRRRPLAWMDARVGARIGAVVGLALVAFFAVAVAIGGLVARYELHRMAGVDSWLTETLHEQFVKAAAVAPAPPELQRFWYSPEFRAGMMLATFGMMSGFLLALSTVGGALGGFMRMRRKASA
ncbi:MAG: zinc ribbon domain-containing protein [Edaphobacter sp.]